MYCNELTIALNITVGSRVVSGPEPRILRVPLEDVEDIRKYLESCAVLKALADKLRGGAAAAVHYAVLQTGERGVIKWQGSDTARSAARSSLRDMMMRCGYEDVGGSWEEFRDKAVNALAGAGMPIEEIRRAVAAEAGKDAASLI